MPAESEVSRALRGIKEIQSTPALVPGTPGGPNPAQMMEGNQNPLRPGAAGSKRTKVDNAMSGLGNRFGGSPAAPAQSSGMKPAGVTSVPRPDAAALVARKLGKPAKPIKPFKPVKPLKPVKPY